jgi:hypothetical protein
VEATATVPRDTITAWFADRQGGRWVEQTVRAAVPTAAPPSQAASSDPAETLRDLTELHRRGVLTEAEFERLRARLRV